MINLPGNPYEEFAQDDPRNPGGTRANATLALAYEQRTANLIAYVETFGGGIEYETVWADIRARLGLGENND